MQDNSNSITCDNSASLLIIILSSHSVISLHSCRKQTPPVKVLADRKVLQWGLATTAVVIKRVLLSTKPHLTVE